MCGSRFITRRALLTTLTWGFIYTITTLHCGAETGTFWARIASVTNGQLPTVKVKVGTNEGLQDNPYLIPDGATLGTIVSTYSDDDTKYPMSQYSYQWQKDGTDISGATDSIYRELTPISFGSNETMMYTVTITEKVKNVPIATGTFVIKKSDITAGSITFKEGSIGVNKVTDPTYGDIYYFCPSISYTMVVSPKGGSGKYKYVWQSRQMFPSTTVPIPTWDVVNTLSTTEIFSSSSEIIFSRGTTDTISREIRYVVLDERDSTTTIPADNDFENPIPLIMRRQLQPGTRLYITGVSRKTGVDAQNKPTYGAFEPTNDTTTTTMELCDGDKVKVHIGMVNFDRDTLLAEEICTTFTDANTPEEGKGYQVSWSDDTQTKGYDVEKEFVCDFGNDKEIELSAVIYEPEKVFCGKSETTGKVTITKSEDLDDFTIESDETTPQPIHCRGEVLDNNNPITLSADKTVPDGKNIVYQWYKSTTDQKPLAKGYKPTGNEVYEETLGWKLIPDSTETEMIFGEGNYLDTTVWYCLKVTRNSGSCSDSVYSQPLSIKTYEPMVVTLYTCGDKASSTSEECQLIGKNHFKKGFLKDSVLSYETQISCPEEFSVDFDVEGRNSTNGYKVTVVKYDDKKSQYVDFDYTSSDDASHKTSHVTTLQNKGSFTLWDNTITSTNKYRIAFYTVDCSRDSIIVNLTMNQPETFAIKSLQIVDSKKDMSGNDSITIKVGGYPHIYLDPYTDKDGNKRGATGGKMGVSTYTTDGDDFKDYKYTWQYNTEDPSDDNKWHTIAVKTGLVAGKAITDVHNRYDMGFDSWAKGTCDTLLADHTTPCVTYYRVIVKDDCPKNKPLTSNVVSVHVESDVVTPTIVFGLKNDTLVCADTKNQTVSVRNIDTIIAHMNSCDALWYRWQIKHHHSCDTSNWWDTTSWTKVTTTISPLVIPVINDSVQYRLITDTLHTGSPDPTGERTRTQQTSNVITFNIPAVFVSGNITIGGKGVNGHTETSGVFGKPLDEPFMIIADSIWKNPNGEHIPTNLDVVLSTPRGGNPFTDENNPSKSYYKYQWQYKDGNSSTDTWFNLVGETLSTCQPVMKSEYGTTIEFRCVVSDHCGEKPSSNIITVNILGALKTPKIGLESFDGIYKKDTLVCPGVVDRTVTIINKRNILDSLSTGEQFTLQWQWCKKKDNTSNPWHDMFTPPLTPYDKTSIPDTLTLNLSTLPTEVQDGTDTIWIRATITSTLVTSTTIYSDTVYLNSSPELEVDVSGLRNVIFGCYKQQFTLEEIGYRCKGGNPMAMDTIIDSCYNMPANNRGDIKYLKECIAIEDKYCWYKIQLQSCNGTPTPVVNIFTAPWITFPSKLSTPCVASPTSVCVGKDFTLSFDTTIIGQAEAPAPQYTTSHITFYGAPQKTYIWQYREGATEGEWLEKARFSNSEGTAFPEGKTSCVVTADKSYYWRLLVEDACENRTITDSLQVVVKPLPEKHPLVEPVVTEVCKNQQEQYTVTSPQEGITYIWKITPDASTGVLTSETNGSVSVTWTGLNTTTNLRLIMSNASTECIDSLDDIPITICNDSVPRVDKILRKPGGNVLVATIADTIDKMGYYVWGHGDVTLQKGSKRYFIAPEDINVSDNYWLTIKRDSTAFCKSTIRYTGTYDDSTRTAAQTWSSQYTVLVTPQAPTEGENTEVNVDNTGGADVTARLYEPRGMKLLRSATVHGEDHVHLTLPMTVPKGLYFLEVQVGVDRKTIKLLVR